jgi:hypothetical protein
MGTSGLSGIRGMSGIMGIIGIAGIGGSPPKYVIPRGWGRSRARATLTGTSRKRPLA